MVSFLPDRRRRPAARLVRELLRLPQVDVERGCLYVHNRRVGHLVLVLHYLYGEKKPLKYGGFLLHFLRRNGLYGSDSGAGEKKKRTMPETVHRSRRHNKAMRTAAATGETGGSERKKKSKAVSWAHKSSINPGIDKYLLS